MPEISRFFGIVIFLFYNDHPPPHVHVRYGETRGRVRIQDGVDMDGTLSPRVAGLVREWVSLQQAALLEDWERARRHEPLQPIPPLE